MKYSYEYKRMCVEQYCQGQWPETPPGAKEKKFRDMIREWVRMEDACGPNVDRYTHNIFLKATPHNGTRRFGQCFDPSESMENVGILDVFPVFHTARLG